MKVMLFGIMLSLFSIAYSLNVIAKVLCYSRKIEIEMGKNNGSNSKR